MGIRRRMFRPNVTKKVVFLLLLVTLGSFASVSANTLVGGHDGR